MKSRDNLLLTIGKWSMDNGIEVNAIQMDRLADRLAEKPTVEHPEWIVNNLAELGVKIGDRFYFLYKGENIRYTKKDMEDKAMYWRPVGKREFGECCHPVKWVNGKYEEVTLYDINNPDHGMHYGIQGDESLDGKPMPNGMWQPLFSKVVKQDDPRMMVCPKGKNCDVWDRSCPHKKEHPFKGSCDNPCKTEYGKMCKCIPVESLVIKPEPCSNPHHNTPHKREDSCYANPKCVPVESAKPKCPKCGCTETRLTSGSCYCYEFTCDCKDKAKEPAKFSGQCVHGVALGQECEKCRTRENPQAEGIEEVAELTFIPNSYDTRKTDEIIKVLNKCVREINGMNKEQK